MLCQTANSIRKILAFALQPKSILLGLAVFNFIALQVRFSEICFYNWKDAAYVAFVVMFAAAVLWVKRWTAPLLAILLCADALRGAIVDWLVYIRLISFGDAEGIEFIRSLNWLEFIKLHERDWLTLILAIVITLYSLFNLAQFFIRLRHTSQNAQAKLFG